MPPLLRPVIRFSRLNAKALDAARRAVEDDDALRGRIAEAVDEARVGRAGWLWLNRPEGWERQLAALVDARAEADADSDLSRRLQQARRDLTPRSWHPVAPTSAAGGRAAGHPGAAGSRR